MIPSAYHLRDFYKTLGGRIVRRLIREKIQSFWPDAKGLSLLGAGYAVPYLKPYRDEAAACFAVMFREHGVHHWPEEEKNLTCLAEEGALPFETNSIDRILLIHSLEFTGLRKEAFEEFWRVLKSNGRILVIVPNRIGLWARSDWTAFGRGAPFSAGQIEDFLKESLFVPERTAKGLFIPPFKSETMLRTAGLWEKTGKYLCPAAGGLIFVEASKQVYATTGKGTRVTAAVASLRPSPVPEPALSSKSETS